MEAGSILSRIDYPESFRDGALVDGVDVDMVEAPVRKGEPFEYPAPGILHKEDGLLFPDEADRARA